MCYFYISRLADAFIQSDLQMMAIKANERAIICKCYKPRLAYVLNLKWEILKTFLQ